MSNELVRKSLVGASSVSSFPSSRFVHLAFAILRRGRVGASESVQDDRRERRRVRPRHRGGISPKELVQRSLSEIPRPERPSVAGDPSSSAPLLPRSLFEPLRGRPFELSRREQSQVDERPVERLVQKFGSFTNRRNGDGDKLVRDGLDRSPPLAQPQRVSRLHVEQVVPRADHVVVVRRGGEDLDEPTRPLRRLVNDRTILRVCARQDEVIANAPPPSREWREVDRRQRRAEDTARRRRTQADRRRAQRNLPREGIRAERARRTSGLIREIRIVEAEAASSAAPRAKVQRGSHRGVVDVLREQRPGRAAEAVTDGSFDESRRRAGHLGLPPRDQPPEQPDARRDEPGAAARGGITNTFSSPLLPAPVADD